jgi:hypothetical protein
VRSSDGHIALSDLPDHIGYYEFESRYHQDRQWRGWVGV